MTEAEMSLRFYRRRAITAARELGYDNSVREAIKNAKSENEISRIMRNARNTTE